MGLSSDSFSIRSLPSQHSIYNHRILAMKKSFSHGSAEDTALARLSESPPNSATFKSQNGTCNGSRTELLHSSESASSPDDVLLKPDGASGAGKGKWENYARDYSQDEEKKTGDVPLVSRSDDVAVNKDEELIWAFFDTNKTDGDLKDINDLTPSIVLNIT